jgi:hypothetical protein
VQSKNIGFADTALVALPLLFPPLKFQLKMAYSWGKWQGRHLSGAWREHS